MRGARARSNVGVRPTVLAAGLAGLVAGACGAEREAPAARGSAAGETSPGDTGAGGISAGRTSVRPACALDNGGLTLPAGFCATVFADSVGGARHIAVAANGDVFVARSSPGRARAGNESGQGARVGVLALRDADGDGRADQQETFGRAGGTGVAVAPGWVYVDEGPRVVRYPVPVGRLTPTGDPQEVVAGLPMGGHAAHNMLLDGRGGLFVNVGSKSNSCQKADRQTGSPGADPCTELATRAGIWRFAADRAGQQFGPAGRYATGIRNAMGLAFDPRDGAMYATQHGRDQLLQNWPQRFTAEQSAELPAEELVRVAQGSDFGWPYCYYDQQQGKLVLAPEYGGDGRQVGTLRGQAGAGGRVPRPLGADVGGVLHGDAVPGPLPRRGVRRLPRLVEPRAAAAGRLQRGRSCRCAPAGRRAGTSGSPTASRARRGSTTPARRSTARSASPSRPTAAVRDRRHGRADLEDRVHRRATLSRDRAPGAA
jgi:glucose/arabinose dehydrogenase